MRNPTLARSFGAIAIAAALALGIAIFVQSARGQDEDATPVVSVPYPTVDPNATPTRTAQELATISIGIQETQVSISATTVAGLVENSESVVGVPHSESSGTRIDPPGTRAAAMIAADRLVSGRVTEQRLEWGTDDVTGTKRAFLVSTLATVEGEAVRVAQRVAIGERPDLTGLRLTYDGGEDLLYANETYLLLAKHDPDDPSRFRPIRGQVYFVAPSGAISRAQSITPMEDPSLMDATSFVAEFNAVRATAPEVLP